MILLILIAEICVERVMVFLTLVSERLFGHNVRPVDSHRRGQYAMGKSASTPIESISDDSTADATALLSIIVIIVAALSFWLAGQ